MDDFGIYGEGIRLIEGARDLGIPYVEIIPELGRLGNNENSTEILRECIEKLVQENIARGEHFEAFQYSKRAADNFRIHIESFSNPSEEYMQELRKTQIALVPELIKSKLRTIENVFKEYNTFAVENDFSDYQLSNKDLNFSGLYQYGLDSDLELKKSDCGKCIIYFDQELGFRFNASLIEENIMPRDISKDGLRNFFRGPLKRLVPAHREIDRPQESQILGGGAYFMKTSKTIFVDFESGNFGRMNKELAMRCLMDSSLNVTTFGDDKYFNTRDIESYLRYHLLGESYENETSSGQGNVTQPKDDDIPF